MLILSRKFNESFVIDGHIVVKVVRLDGDTVKLGIAAPMDVPVHREEIFTEIRRNNREALVQSRVAVPRLNSALFAVPLPQPAGSKPADPAKVPVVASVPAVPPTPASRTKVKAVKPTARKSKTTKPTAANG
jgi:carbon storage regulator